DPLAARHRSNEEATAHATSNVNDYTTASRGPVELPTIAAANSTGQLGELNHYEWIAWGVYAGWILRWREIGVHRDAPRIHYNSVAMSTPLIELVENLPRSRVALLGDLMLDRYMYGNAERLSPEAPVPVLHYQREELRLGGAGGVAADLAALNATVRVIGVVGADEIGTQVRKHLVECGADPGTLVHAQGRPTICKVRLVGLAQHRHPQQMMRLDIEDPTPLGPEVARQVLEKLEEVLAQVDLLCNEDYNKGLLTPDLCRKAIEMARQR